MGSVLYSLLEYLSSCPHCVASKMRVGTAASNPPLRSNEVRLRQRMIYHDLINQVFWMFVLVVGS